MDSHIIRFYEDHASYVSVVPGLIEPMRHAREIFLASQKHLGKYRITTIGSVLCGR
jgi:hypothetical protein